eukprot:scaffold47715_cov33-Phaeocystis_antarctica.AAC.1
MFFVQSGTVEILCAFEGGELRLDCQEQGSYFGEVSRCYLRTLTLALTLTPALTLTLILTLTLAMTLTTDPDPNH